MSRKKLTLSVDEDALKRARRYSTSRGMSISELVSRFLSSLGDPESGTPTVKRLRGTLPPEADVDGYRRYLVEKYEE